MGGKNLTARGYNYVNFKALVTIVNIKKAAAANHDISHATRRCFNDIRHLIRRGGKTIIKVEAGKTLIERSIG